MIDLPKVFYEIGDNKAYIRKVIKDKNTLKWEIREITLGYCQENSIVHCGDIGKNYWSPVPFAIQMYQWIL